MGGIYFLTLSLKMFMDVSLKEFANFLSLICETRENKFSKQREVCGGIRPEVTRYNVSLTFIPLSLVLEEEPSTLRILFPSSDGINAFQTNAGQTPSSHSLTKIIPDTLKSIRKRTFFLNGCSPAWLINRPPKPV